MASIETYDTTPVNDMNECVQPLLSPHQSCILLVLHCDSLALSPRLRPTINMVLSSDAVDPTSHNFLSVRPDIDGSIWLRTYCWHAIFLLLGTIYLSFYSRVATTICLTSLSMLNHHLWPCEGFCTMFAAQRNLWSSILFE